MPKYGDVFQLRGRSKVMYVAADPSVIMYHRWYGVVLDAGSIPFAKDGTPYIVGETVAFSSAPPPWSRVE